MTAMDALDLVIERVPALAPKALRVKANFHGPRSFRYIREVFEAAVESGKFTDDESQALRSIVADTSRSRLSVNLPQIRVTQELFDEIAESAHRNKRSMADEIRHRITNQPN